MQLTCVICYTLQNFPLYQLSSFLFFLLPLCLLTFLYARMGLSIQQRPGPACSPLRLLACMARYCININFSALLQMPPNKLINTWTAACLIYYYIEFYPGGGVEVAEAQRTATVSREAQPSNAAQANTVAAQFSSSSVSPVFNLKQARR